MATHSIGSAVGRDYARIDDWFAAIPATLTANEIGQLYNDSEFVPTTATVFSGKTVGSFSITLSTATGQGFADSKANVGFKYSYVASQGVAFRSTTGYLQPLIRNSQAGMAITGIQVKTTISTSGCIRIDQSSSTSYLKNIIADSAGSSASVASSPIHLSGGIAINCLAISRGSAVGIGTEYGSVAINCLAVVPAGGAAAATGITHGGGTNTLTNCASFGFTAAYTSGGWGGSSNYNISDDTTAPGANSLLSKVYANQFVSTTDDFRLKSGADCIDHGNTDATNAPLDAVGTTRGLTTLGDIGPWEYVAPSGNNSVSPGVGSLTITGYAPTVSQSGGSNTAVNPGVGSLAITGYAPTIAQTTLGTVTTAALEANTTTVQANLTGLYVNVLATTGALVVGKSGQTTNASGVLAVTDALIVPGTYYHLAIVGPSTGAAGITNRLLAA